MKPTKEREAALKWWQKELSKSEQEHFAHEFYDRDLNFVTGREIESMHKFFLEAKHLTFERLKNT